VYIIYIKPQFNKLNCNEILLDSIFDTNLINTFSNSIIDDSSSKNYKKFKNKKIITCLFTLDTENYYSFNWNDLIYENNKIFNQKIKEKIFNKYKIECKYLYYFYTYYLNELNDKSPEIIIKIISNKIKEKMKTTQNKAVPKFIEKLFDEINGNIRKCKTDKNDVLYFYADKNNFNNQLNDLIESSIDMFLDN
jgi:hypothetical protein